MTKPIDFSVEKSENYLKTKVESNFNGIAVTDEQGSFEYVNDSFLEITGWSREELIGQLFLKVFPENMHEFMRERWEELQKGIEIPYVTTIETKGGEIKYVEVSHSYSEIAGNKRFISAIKLIPEKKEPAEIVGRNELELALKETEDRYKDLFENALDGIYINDAEGYIQNINKAGLKALGCRAEDVIGTHVSRWFTPDSNRLTMESVRKKMLGEPVEDPMVREVITWNGEHRWAEIRSCVIKKGDRVLGFQGIARDITEKIKLENKLKESEAKYRELFENAQYAMYVIDIDGNFLKMNMAGLGILGGAEEEVIGSNLSKWLTPESLKIVEMRRQKLLSGEFIEPVVTLELVSKNGEHKWLEVKSRLIKDYKTAEIHGIANDVTENIILKKELMKSNKQRKLLCYLITDTRGGKTRALILKYLVDKPYNTNQLARAMNMDYKTIRHHLDVLVKHGIVAKEKDGYTTWYSLSKNAQDSLYLLEDAFKNSKFAHL